MPTDKDDVRFCSECQREVHFCADVYELANAVALNRCVAIIVEVHVGKYFMTGMHKAVDFEEQQIKD
jgi:hypothetical protein